MQKKILLLILIVFPLLVITSYQFYYWGILTQTYAQQKMVKSGKQQITFEGGEGDSLENAVIIKGAQNSIQGIAAESRYLRNKFGKKNVDWNLVRQSVITENDRYYDLMRIRFNDGTEKKVFFDITDFFGKF